MAHDGTLFMWCSSFSLGACLRNRSNNFGACWTLLEGLHSLSSIPHFYTFLTQYVGSHRRIIWDLRPGTKLHDGLTAVLGTWMGHLLDTLISLQLASLVTMVSHQQAAILKPKMENKTWQTPMINLRLGLAHTWCIYIYIMYDCVCNWWLFIIFITNWVFLIIIAIAGVSFLTMNLDHTCSAKWCASKSFITFLGDRPTVYPTPKRWNNVWVENHMKTIYYRW